ncbi:MAG: DNA recombination protein RmuC [bacterium]|nr:DNA recombination protein RmuC [bacterium]
MIELLLGLLVVLHIILIAIVLLKSRDKQLHKRIDDGLTGTETRILDEFARNRRDFNHSIKELREEIHGSITSFSDLILKRITGISQLQNMQFENTRKAVDDQLKTIRKENTDKLEEMRQTVEEKLHATLETRLGQAFKQVGDRLEKVHLGLGEMQKLAAGVGDLKNVLTNVKTRGTLGEVQLENQLSQLLTTSQYAKNVKTKESGNDFVEFAVKLPGRDDTECIWLPLDSKFPLGQYEMLLKAYHAGDKEAVRKVSMRMAAEIKGFAKTIRDKYLDPPRTTDFALMYLPVEGLYAEVLRTEGLFEVLHKTYRIIPVGPSTLAAILNSLQMGFRTLAIEKRSSEVWKLLGAVKTQFGKFGDLLDKTRKKLDEAGKSIDDASRKTRHIEGRLSRVQELPTEEPLIFPEDN